MHAHTHGRGGRDENMQLKAQCMALAVAGRFKPQQAPAAAETCTRCAPLWSGAAARAGSRRCRAPCGCASAQPLGRRSTGAAAPECSAPRPSRCTFRPRTLRDASG
eukprot:6185046-Pleurochrysis_carterae.AAC.1